MISVIIPSRDRSNLLPCLRAVGQHEPGAWRIVVDDGVNLRPEGEPGWYGAYEQVVRGIKPFVFARNCNIGIEAARERLDASTHSGGAQMVAGPYSDVILLNDDALLTTPGGFTAMAKAADKHPEIGIIGAACNNVGNPNQFPRGIGLREEPRMVCFVCVYIPRRTIDLVGLLDERYTGYGMDDDDYCFSVRKAGLKIAVLDGCVIDHKSGHSSFRGPAGAGGDFRGNLEIFKRKWHCDNWGRPA